MGRRMFVGYFGLCVEIRGGYEGIGDSFYFFYIFEFMLIE